MLLCRAACWAGAAAARRIAKAGAKCVRGTLEAGMVSSIPLGCPVEHRMLTHGGSERSRDGYGAVLEYRMLTRMAARNGFCEIALRGSGAFAAGAFAPMS